MSEIVTLDANCPSIRFLCDRDKRFAKLFSMVGDISYTIHDDGYAFLLHEIIEQMLSIKVGHAIYNRLCNYCNDAITPQIIATLSDEKLRSTGMSGSKVVYIRNITQSIIDGSLQLDTLSDMSDIEALKHLTQFKGIGTWTAKMYLIFVLDRHDILPYEDGAFLQAYRWLYKTDDISKKAIEKKCKKWKPYSSIAARYMYRALDSGLTKREFHLFK